MKKKVFIILLFFLLCIGGCSINPPAKEANFKYGNDCLPQAIIMSKSLEEKDIESHVLIIRTPSFAHALCEYIYPENSDKIWVWDRTWKSLRIRADKNDPYSVGAGWMKESGHSERVIYAEFLK